MWEAVKKQWTVQWKDWRILMLFILGGWIFGMILHFVIVALDSSITSYFPMGTVMAVVIAGLCAGVMWAIQLGFYFNLEISMGSTRKGFLISFYLVGFLFELCYIGEIILLNLAERVLERQLYSDLECEIDILPYLLKWGVPAMAAIMFLCGFMGTLILRYGKKASWALWLIWMFCFLVLPRIHDAAEKAPDSLFGRIGNAVIGTFEGMTLNVIVGIAAVLSILSFAGSWIYLRKQQVVS